MRRAFVCVPFMAMLLVITLAHAQPALAGKGGKVDPFTWGATVYRSTQAVVEQQSDFVGCCTPIAPVITNPLLPQCAWDVDDAWHQFGGGDLGAGQTVTGSLCMVSDHNPSYQCFDGVCGWGSGQRVRHSVSLGSPSAGLMVQVCYAPQGRCFTLAPQAVDAGYRYTLCSHVVYDPSDPALVEIPNSNGGLGVVTTITTSVQNRTSATVRDNGLLHELVGVGRSAVASPPPCAFGVYPTTYDYPFEWTLP
jgi:hypothetical protein